MEKPEISIIIPAYNAEKFIERCLMSCLSQLYVNIEVVVVDDCSTDHTVEVVERISDCRIKLLRHTTNRGAGGARNTGIKHASGRYVGFVDADDIIEPDFYAKLLDGFQAEGVDIVMGATRFVNEKTKLLSHQKQNPVEDFSAKLGMLFNGSVCDKLFRASLLVKNGILFQEGCYWEDNLFIIQAIFYARRLQVVSDAIYNYIEQPNSSTQAATNGIKRQQDTLLTAQATVNFMEKANIKGEERNQVVDFLVKHTVHPPVIEGRRYYKDAIQILGHNAKLKHKRNRYVRKQVFKFLQSLIK